MKYFSAISPILGSILFLHFALIVQGFGSTWELYQVFNSKHGKNNSTNQSNSSSQPDEEGSKIPLVFTFNPDQNVRNLTTGRGRVLFVGNENPNNENENYTIPRFTSEPEETTDVSSKSGFSFSSLVELILQFITMEDLMEWLTKLRKALISYYGSSNYLLGGQTNELSKGRDGWGGIGFPSLEGALLSLAFLTFAVFLIDLIQNLLANLRVPTTTGGGTITGGGMGGGGMIQIPTRGKREASSESWMSMLTKSVLSAIEGNF